MNLPEQLVQQARLQRRHAPVRAAVLAQIAVAVAILTVAPIRLANLASIRLGENLIKPGGPYSNFWLTFPKYDVKNRTPLQFKLDETVTDVTTDPRNCSIKRWAKSSLRTPSFDSPAGSTIAASLDPPKRASICGSHRIEFAR